MIFLALEVGGVVMPFQPTIKNYSVSVEVVGTSRRTLSGALDVHRVVEKKTWTITVPDYAGLHDLSLGVPFNFKDFDGTVHQVVMMSRPLRNRPEVAETTLVLEEV